MGIYQIVATGVLCAVLAITVKRQSPEMALMITIAASVLIFLMVLPFLAQTMEVFSQLSGVLDGPMGGYMRYVGLVMRVIGVAYMAELGASVCQDAGESAIAMKIDMAGRVIILVLALPILVEIVSIVMGLLP